MNNIVKNILLLVAVLVLSYFSAGYFGMAYDSMFGSGGAWIGSEGSWNLIIGFPLALLFFLTLFSYTWIFKSKKPTLWLISPVLLWEVVIDIRHIYIPIALTLVALGLAILLQKIFKISTTNKSYPR